MYRVDSFKIMPIYLIISWKLEVGVGFIITFFFVKLALFKKIDKITHFEKVLVKSMVWYISQLRNMTF
jgi:hypothetical protein